MRCRRLQMSALTLLGAILHFNSGCCYCNASSYLIGVQRARFVLDCPRIWRNRNVGRLSAAPRGALRSVPRWEARARAQRPSPRFGHSGVGYIGRLWRRWWEYRRGRLRPSLPADDSRSSASVAVQIAIGRRRLVCHGRSRSHVAGQLERPKPH